MVSSYYLACKSSQQSVLPLISLVVFLPLCMEMWSSPSVVAEWWYNGPPYIDFCPVPARHGCVLLVPARPDFLKRFKEGARVDLRWPPAQLPDLVQTRGKAQNGLHTHPWPNLWPPTPNQRLKCDHRAWSLSASLQGVEYVLEGGGRGLTCYLESRIRSAT